MAGPADEIGESRVYDQLARGKGGAEDITAAGTGEGIAWSVRMESRLKTVERPGRVTRAGLTKGSTT